MVLTTVITSQPTAEYIIATRLLGTEYTTTTSLFTQLVLSTLYPDLPAKTELHKFMATVSIVDTVELPIVLSGRIDARHDPSRSYRLLTTSSSQELYSAAYHGFRARSLSVLLHYMLSIYCNNCLLASLHSSL